MKKFVFVTQDDPHEWQVHDQADSADAIKALPCFRPDVTSIPKILFPAWSSEPWSLKPCFAGGGTGNLEAGTIYEIGDEGRAALLTESADLFTEEDLLTADDE